MVAKSAILILSTVLIITAASDSYHDDLVNELRSKISGKIYRRGSPAFEALRLVPNGGCNHIIPALIVRPENEYEVSVVVQTATKYDIPISVRSGGHGYQCTGLKHNSLNIDMRNFRTVKLLSPHEAILGTGNTWGEVLDVIKPEYYTMIHGQCNKVGVGGFLMGLGSNAVGTSSRFGTGADNVLEYTVILADGTIAKVNNDNTTLLGSDYQGSEVIPHGYENDLRFALRSSGPSFAIATQVKYRIYPKPETLPMMIPIYIENLYDFQRVQRASEQGRFGIMLGELYFFRRPELTNIVGTVMDRGPTIMKALGGKKLEPVVAIVMDLKAPGRKGNIRSALNFFKFHGIKLAIDSEAMFRTFGLDAIDLGVNDQTDYYLTEDQRKREGFASIGAASMNHLETAEPIANVFFNHPVMGLYHKRRNLGARTGCDFCNWFLYFGNPKVPLQTVAGKFTGHIASEVDCSYNPRNRYKAKKCEDFVRKLKHTFTVDAFKAGEKPSQYVNTPSCDDIGDHFSVRYWGSNYERLLKIKEYWDPANVFNHCQSVGSTSETCCPLP